MDAFFALALAASPVDAAAGLVASPAFRTAAVTLDREHERTVGEIIELAEIPAPPFKESVRARAYAAKFAALGLRDVTIDAAGNVTALRPGREVNVPLLVVSAHLDTVFPEGTDVRVRREGTRLSAPGIADDSRGLAVLLAWARALDAARIATRIPILFVGTVGEEGAGDLRGVRYLFGQGPYKGRVGAFFSVDGLDPARIVTGGVGSKRYRVRFRGPGGHSYGAFGIVNPAAAMARAIADLYAVAPPVAPKVTYSASIFGGGTSVNAIPSETWVDVDMRSADAPALAGLDARFRRIVADAVAGENRARSTAAGAVTAQLDVIGDRPAGRTDATGDFARSTAAAVAATGYRPSFEDASTDANVAMGLGIPALTIGSGGTGGRAHAPDEWIDVAKPESLRGMTAGLAAVLMAAGVD